MIVIVHKRAGKYWLFCVNFAVFRERYLPQRNLHDTEKISLIFLKQQENIELKTEYLTAIRRIINQIELHRLSSLKQQSITHFLC